MIPRSSAPVRVGRRYAAHKRAALAAHRSQVYSTGRSARLARAMLALPVPVFGLLFGREWFAEPGPRPDATAAARASGPRRAGLV